ncbi:response regulator [Elusimicrobiota bacterium]
MTIRVFLADDHAVIRDGICAMLEAEKDIEVLGTADNGREAVSQANKLNPDVIVMDIAMPEMNGIEAARRIQKSDPSIRIIILSMHDSSEYVFQALKAGAKGYLLKESAGKEVIKAIRTVYSGRRYLSMSIEEKVIDDYISEQGITTLTSPIEKLSERERDVLKKVVEGRSSKQIAADLFISQKTVETYRSRLMQKIGVKNIPSLVKFALQHGIITLDK